GAGRAGMVKGPSRAENTRKIGARTIHRCRTGWRREGMKFVGRAYHMDQQATTSGVVAKNLTILDPYASLGRDERSSTKSLDRLDGDAGRDGLRHGGLQLSSPRDGRFRARVVCVYHDLRGGRVACRAGADSRSL